MSRSQTIPRDLDAEALAVLQLGGRNTGFDADDLADDELANGKCEICERPGRELTRHHLIPRSRHRKARSKRQFSREEMRTRIAHICSDCHCQIHLLFTEKELAADFNTLEDLKGHEGMQKFVGYIQKKH